MKHPIHRVTGFQIVAPFYLQVTFADGLSRMIDFQPFLKGELLSPLRDRKIFDAVAIDPEVHTLVWPNGADFDPATLHDWPERDASMKELADAWGENPAD
jgi:hypothetical protein